MADEPSSAGTERTPQRKFTPTGHAPYEHEAADICASDQQDKERCPHQYQEWRAYVANDHPLERHRIHATPSVCERKRLFQPLGDAVKLPLGCCYPLPWF